MITPKTFLFTIFSFNKILEKIKTNIGDVTIITEALIGVVKLNPLKKVSIFNPTPKNAAKKVGLGLPTLYTRLREKGLFTRVDGKNLPSTQLQSDGLFKVSTGRYWNEKFGQYVPTYQVMATFKGLILLQETADEVEREKAESRDKRSRVRDRSNSSKEQSSVRGEDTERRAAGHAG